MRTLTDNRLASPTRGSHVRIQPQEIAPHRLRRLKAKPKVSILLAFVAAPKLVFRVRKKEAGKDTLCSLLSAVRFLKAGEKRLTYKGAHALAHPYHSRKDSSRALHTQPFTAIKDLSCMGQDCLMMRISRTALLARSQQCALNSQGGMQPAPTKRTLRANGARMQSRAGVYRFIFCRRERQDSCLSVKQRLNKERLNSASRAARSD